MTRMDYEEEAQALVWASSGSEESHWREERDASNGWGEKPISGNLLPRLLQDPGWTLHSGQVPEKQTREHFECEKPGSCLACGMGRLLSNVWHHPDKGYLLVRQCSTMLQGGACSYFWVP